MAWAHKEWKIRKISLNMLQDDLCEDHCKNINSEMNTSSLGVPKFRLRRFKLTSNLLQIASQILACACGMVPSNVKKKQRNLIGSIQASSLRAALKESCALLAQFGFQLRVKADMNNLSKISISASCLHSGVHHGPPNSADGLHVPKNC